MPSNHGRRLDEYQGVEELKLHSAEPNPGQTVGQEEPKTAGALPPKNKKLMSQGDKLSSSDARLRTPDETRETRADRTVIMHPDAMATASENP
jgi:hypothetical protein